MLENQELTGSLSDDLSKLKSNNISWGLRMAITYRSEKKKILRSQLMIVQMMIYLVSHCVDAIKDGVYR